ncbi:MAG: cupin domain-containing protein [Chloroflexota bacterium]
MGMIRRRRIENDRERWSDVEMKTYRALGGPLGYKHILIGPDDGAANFAMRIFQIPPGKHSKEEEHAHDHGVFIMQGKGRVLLGGEMYDIEAGDAVWVEPDERHRFDNVGEGTLQFLCVIPAWGELDSPNRPPAPGEQKAE